MSAAQGGAGGALAVTSPFLHRYPPQTVRFGTPAAQAVADLLIERGRRRAVLICGENLGASDLAEAIATCSRVIDVWDGVRPHSPADSIDTGTERITELGADALVSLGGGSAHDTMRAIALCALTGRRMREQFSSGSRHVRLPHLNGLLSLVAVPSTLSAAETGFGGGTVFSGQKFVFTSDSLHVGDIVLDPELFATTPRPVLLSTGLNAMHHAIGRLLSAHHQPIADAQFLHALRLLGPALPALAPTEEVDSAALADAVIGAHLSGSTNVVGGAGHAVAHVLGGRYAIPHGVAHALALLHVTAPLAARRPQRARMIADALGIPAQDSLGPDLLSPWLAQLLDTLGLPARLSDAGVPGGEIDDIAAEVAADFSTSAAGDQPLADEIRVLLTHGW